MISFAYGSVGLAINVKNDHLSRQKGIWCSVWPDGESLNSDALHKPSNGLKSVKCFCRRYCRIHRQYISKWCSSDYFDKSKKEIGSAFIKTVNIPKQVIMKRVWNANKIVSFKIFQSTAWKRKSAKYFVAIIACEFRSCNMQPYTFDFFDHKRLVIFFKEGIGKTSMSGAE